MLIQRLLLVLCLFSPITLRAQYKISEGDKNYANELKETYNEAEAAIKFSEIRFEFDLNKQGEPVCQEKINNEFVSLRLNQSIKLAYYYDNYSSIEQYENFNYKNKRVYLSPVCGDVMVDDIFYHDRQFCGYKLSFASIGETQKFSITKGFSDLKYLTNFFLGDYYPIVDRKFIIVIPQWLDLDIKESNFDKFPVKKSSLQLSDGSTQITYEISNMDAMKTEPLSKGISFVYPEILFMAKSYTSKNGKHTIISSKDDLYNWYHSLANDEGQNAESVKTFTADLVKSSSTTEQKIKTIYYWVQDNIRYIAFENGLAGFKPELPEKVLKNKYGDCKGMANLLKAMLTSVGIDARLTWLGTNSVLYDYSTPSLSSDNHMICTVFLNNKKIFLDATERYCPLNSIGERIQGRQVIIENGDSYIFDSIPEYDYSQNEFKKEIKLSIKDNKLSGSVMYTVNGEKKTSFLTIYHQLKTDKKEEALKSFFKENDNVSFHDVNLQHEENRDSSLIVKATFEIENQISEFNNEIYIPLNAFENTSYFEMKKDRESDLYFDEKIDNVSETIIDIPKGMSVKYLPKDLKINNEFFRCTITCRSVGGKIHVNKELIIPKAYVPVEKKDAWNDLQKKLKSYNSEQFILTRI